MFKKSGRGNLLIWLSVGTPLLWPGILRAENNIAALLTVSFNHGRVTAGMMCNGAGDSSIDPAGDPPRSQKFETPGSVMCRRSSASVLTPDILAFDVTLWPRQAIAELASLLHLMDDPLNYDFSRVKLAGRQVRRIDENRGEESLAPHIFEFSFGSYLLMKVPGPTPVSGS
jgi:hypothetical protein